MIALMIGLGALVGAPARYLIDRRVQARLNPVFPWGTFTVNIAASLVLGIVVGAPTNATTSALIGTGFCGALSTYSTFGYETMRLAGRGNGRAAALNVVLSLVVGVAAAALGWVIGARL